MSAPSTRDRAAAAATAAERLAARLAGEGTEDPITVAYIYRLLEATARIEDYATRALGHAPNGEGRIEPDPNYLGRLTPSLGTSAERYA